MNFLTSLNFDPYHLVLVALAGWILGSFNTMLCYRIPREIPLGLFSHQRSKCPECEQVIPWHNNIPIFSYLFLRGKCSQCGVRIPLRYFLIEVSTLFSFVLTYLVFANGNFMPQSRTDEIAELIKLLYFTFALVATVFIDLEFRIIPDRFSLGNCSIALAASALWGAPQFMLALLGGLVGSGMFFLMAYGYEKLKGVEGLGFGDVKMMGWLGTWLGLAGVPLTILIASVSGLAVGLIAMRKSRDGFQTAIPFGPFLALGAYLTWILQSRGQFE